MTALAHTYGVGVWGFSHVSPICPFPGDVSDPFRVLHAGSSVTGIGVPPRLPYLHEHPGSAEEGAPALEEVLPPADDEILEFLRPQRPGLTGTEGPWAVEGEGGVRATDSFDEIPTLESWARQLDMVFSDRRLLREVLLDGQREAVTAKVRPAKPDHLEPKPTAAEAAEAAAGAAATPKAQPQNAIDEELEAHYDVPIGTACSEKVFKKVLDFARQMQESNWWGDRTPPEAGVSGEKMFLPWFGGLTRWGHDRGQLEWNDSEKVPDEAKNKVLSFKGKKKVWIESVSRQVFGMVQSRMEQLLCAGMLAARIVDEDQKEKLTPIIQQWHWQLQHELEAFWDGNGPIRIFLQCFQSSYTEQLYKSVLLN